MTYVDQCDTIRTLTEEEMAHISGGRGPVMSQSTLFAMANAFHNAPLSRFLPKPGTLHNSNYFNNFSWAINYALH